MNTEKAPIQAGTFPAPSTIYIQVVENGPYIVHGAPPLCIERIMPNAKGNSWSYKVEKTLPAKEPMKLCRCGESKNKPYCDGAHRTATDVDLRETASFEPMLDGSDVIEGPKLTLTDNEKYCAYGRFCDNGHRIWDEVNIDDEASEELTTYMAHQCPAGRLLIFDNETQTPIESKLEPQLSLLEDGILKLSAGLKVNGGIRIESASGRSYEVRNRQALCRCGQSANKPFCDGTHASMNFQDGLTEF